MIDATCKAKDWNRPLIWTRGPWWRAIWPAEWRWRCFGCKGYLFEHVFLFGGDLCLCGGALGYCLIRYAGQGCRHEGPMRHSDPLAASLAGTGSANEGEAGE